MIFVYCRCKIVVCQNRESLKEWRCKKIRTKLDSKGTKDKIIELFFEEHSRPTDIAKKLKVGKSYVTKVIQKDERYNSEKEKRRTLSLEKHKTCKRNYIRKKREEQKQAYQTMLLQIERDNKYLSTKKKMNDIAFTKWNRGMFDYDKNSSDLVLRKGIVTGYNVPKRVSNVVSAHSIKSAY